MLLPRIAAVSATLPDLPGIDTDLLVVPVFEDDDLTDVPAVDAATNGEARRSRARGEFTAKLHDVFLTPIVAPGWKAERLALVGAGPRHEYTIDRARRLSTTACSVARQRGIGRLAILQRGSALDELQASRDARWFQAAAEGAALATFDAAPYKTSRDRPGPREVLLLATTQGALHRRCERAVSRGVCVGECTNLARELINEPANRLTPAVLAERARDIGAVPGLRVEVLDQEMLEALGMGLLLGVAAGSRQPPYVIVLEYTPRDAPPGPVLGLVGKGITFDAGGLTVGRGHAPENMKEDMAGGAAVICAMRAIALLEAPVRVLGVVPAAENMPGAGALKPGDVLRAASGTTVEVLNTDAEGRLVLADGLWYARHRGATHLVDIATLTNACVTALGEFTTGLFGTPPMWVRAVRHCADLAGDRCWPMPLFEEYFEQLRSDIADISNSGGPAAGAITAALFLRSFSGGLPWAHLDIAGTAWSCEGRQHQPKGPTGVGVRALAQLALSTHLWAERVDRYRDDPKTALTGVLCTDS